MILFEFWDALFRLNLSTPYFLHFFFTKSYFNMKYLFNKQQAWSRINEDEYELHEFSAVLWRQAALQSLQLLLPLNNLHLQLYETNTSTKKAIVNR